MISLKKWKIEIKIEVQRCFLREFKHLQKHYPSLVDDVKNLRTELEANPNLGVDMGNGIHKIRMSISSKGKGKSGGARVITFNVIISADSTTVTLLYIYDKSERSSISKSEIKALIEQNGL